MAHATAGEQGQELAYALITPYSLHKSRTGGIVARLLWANVRLVAARMYAPRSGSEFLTRYCDAIYDPQERSVPLRYQRLLIEYVAENFARPCARGISNRMLLFVFSGPNAQADIAEAIGHISEDVRGDDVRGTFGDNVSESWDRSNLQEVNRRSAEALGRYPALQQMEVPPRRTHFFEPALLTGVTPQMTEAHLKLFRQFAYSDGGFVLDAVGDEDRAQFETSMVVLKPENFRHKNPLPGNLIDFFARTGMRITGAKMIHLGIDKAREFYSLKLAQFRESLKSMIEREAREIVQKARQLAESAVRAFGADPDEAFRPARAIPAAMEAQRLFGIRRRGEPGKVKEPVLTELFRLLPQRLDTLEPDEAVYAELAEQLKDVNAQVEFNELIRYMSGEDPDTGQPIEQGPQTLCMALLYSGKNGLRVIRQRLKELREIYGRNILVNRAHASDPEEDPAKEMQVVGMPCAPGGEARPCDVEQVVSEFYGTD